MTFTPPALVAMLPPTVLEPLEAKSTGHVRPCSAQWRCTASVTAPACTRTVLPSRSTGPRRAMRWSDSTTSPFAATAPPARPVRPPDGTTATACWWHRVSSRATSSVVRGSATALGAGAYTRVQSRPYSFSSSASWVRKSAGKPSERARRKSAGSGALEMPQAYCRSHPVTRCGEGPGAWEVARKSPGKWARCVYAGGARRPAGASPPTSRIAEDAPEPSPPRRRPAARLRHAGALRAGGGDTRAQRALRVRDGGQLLHHRREQHRGHRHPPGREHAPDPGVRAPRLLHPSRGRPACLPL